MKKYKSVFSDNTVEIKTSTVGNMFTTPTTTCFSIEIFSDVDGEAIKVTLSKEDSINLAQTILNTYTDELLGG